MAQISQQKLIEMEAEMDRFEQEILSRPSAHDLPRVIIGSSTFTQVSAQLKMLRAESSLSEEERMKRSQDISAQLKILRASAEQISSRSMRMGHIEGDDDEEESEEEDEDADKSRMVKDGPVSEMPFLPPPPPPPPTLRPSGPTPSFVPPQLRNRPPPPPPSLGPPRMRPPPPRPPYGGPMGPGPMMGGPGPGPGPYPGGPRPGFGPMGPMGPMRPMGPGPMGMGPGPMGPGHMGPGPMGMPHRPGGPHEPSGGGMYGVSSGEAHATGPKKEPSPEPEADKNKVVYSSAPVITIQKKAVLKKKKKKKKKVEEPTKDNPQADTPLQTTDTITLPTPSGPSPAPGVTIPSAAMPGVSAPRATIEEDLSYMDMEIEPTLAHKKEKKEKKKKFIRSAAGQAWEDLTLAEWDQDDFRLFCGDLGNEVTDETLARAFVKYPTFVKAKVIRDKRSNKTKGYGFVSFRDPNDYVRAIREMNGYAYTDAECKTKSVSVVEDSADFYTAQLIAHDLGHSLGCDHNGDGNTCPRGGGFDMDAAFTLANSRKWTFSSCSTASIQNYINSLNREVTNCLLSIQNPHPEAQLISASSRQFGQVYNADQQFQLK